MKKIYFVALTIIASMFASCSLFDGKTPETSTTKLYPAMDPSAENWGFIDNKGNFVITPMFDDVEGFSCGYARVLMGEDYKFINTKGQFQTTPSFDWAESFYNGYAVIGLDDNQGLMKSSFDMTIQPYFYRLGTMGDNGLSAAKRTNDGKYEYVNAKGETKIPAMYDGADKFQDGVAIIALGNKYGAINKAGEFTIQPTHEYGLWNMTEGLVGFYDKNEKAGFMDKNGNIIAPAIYYGVGYASDGLIVYGGKDKCGYLNKKGEIVIAEMYYAAEQFTEGLAWVKQNEDSKYWQCINKENQVVFRLGEDETPYAGFHNGLALVRVDYKDGYGYKYVDINGMLVYSWKYTYEDYDDEDYYDEWGAPKKAQKRDFMSEKKAFLDMTLHFDSRKL